MSPSRKKTDNCHRIPGLIEHSSCSVKTGGGPMGDEVRGWEGRSKPGMLTQGRDDEDAKEAAEPRTYFST